MMSAKIIDTVIFSKPYIGRIYLIENIINHKIYIGQTMQSLRRRLQRHIWDAANSKEANSKLHRAIVKYGNDKFIISKLYDCKTEEELNKLERWFILFFMSTLDSVGYNIQNGGKGFGKFTDISKRKMSISASGINNHNFGKRLSPETRAKISLSKIGNKNMLGKSVSNETRRKIGEAQSGAKNHMWGKHHSEETRKKISEGVKAAYRRQCG